MSVFNDLMLLKDKTISLSSKNSDGNRRLKEIVGQLKYISKQDDYEALGDILGKVGFLIRDIESNPVQRLANSDLLSVLKIVKSDLKKIHEDRSRALSATQKPPSGGMAVAAGQTEPLIQRANEQRTVHINPESQPPAAQADRFSPAVCFNQGLDWRNGKDFCGACYGYVEKYGEYRLRTPQAVSTSPLPANFHYTQQIHVAQFAQNIESIDTKNLVKKRLDRKRLELDPTKRGDRILSHLDNNKGSELRIAMWTTNPSFHIVTASKAVDGTITFFDPNAGVFKFTGDNADTDFKEFYTDLHKRYLEKGGLNYSVYEVRKVALADSPNEGFEKNWTGTWRSFLTGNKYNLSDNARGVLGPLFSAAEIFHTFFSSSKPDQGAVAAAPPPLPATHPQIQLLEDPVCMDFSLIFSKRYGQSSYIGQEEIERVRSLEEIVRIANIPKSPVGAGIAGLNLLPDMMRAVLRDAYNIHSGPYTVESVRTAIESKIEEQKAPKASHP